MTMQHDDPFTTHPDLAEIGTTFAMPPPQPARRDRRPIIIGLAIVAILALSGGVWWLLASTVSSDEYDEVAAELATTRSALALSERTAEQEAAARQDEIADLGTVNDELGAQVAALDEANRSLTDRLAEGDQQITVLTAEGADLADRLDAVASYVDVLTYWELNLDPAWVEELDRLGADPSRYDSLLERTGHDESMDSWLEFGNAWFHANTAVLATGDDELVDEWVTWNESFDTDEGAVAMDAFFIRLLSLMQDGTE